MTGAYSFRNWNFRILIILPAVVLLFGILPAYAVGPIVIGGDDLTDHGGNDGSLVTTGPNTGACDGTNFFGWKYIQNAVTNILADELRDGDHDVGILVFGSGPGSDCGDDTEDPPFSDGGEAGAAIGSAALKAGTTVRYCNGSAAIDTCFTDLGTGAVNPQMFYIAGTGAGNDISFDEGVTITSHAAEIADYVNSGGGLLAHGSGESAFGWLSTVLPGFEFGGHCDNTGAVLTPAGALAFPLITNTDIRAGPCHDSFSGNFGGLTVFAFDTDGHPFIVGAAAGLGSIEDPCADSPGLPDGAGFLLALLVPEQFRAFGGEAPQERPPCADLSLTKSVDDSTPIQGGLVTYTFTVTNDGPDDVDFVQVNDNYDGFGLDFFDFDVIEGCNDGASIDENDVTVDICGIEAGETVVFTITYIVDEIGSLFNFAEVTLSQIDIGDDVIVDILDPDSAPDNGNGETAEEDDEATRTIVPCNDEEPPDIPEIADFLLSLLIPEMFRAYGGEITPDPIVPCSTKKAAGAPYDDPTLGITVRSGYFAISDGFCFDQFCLDVLEYFNHLPIQQVSSGSTHTITLTAYIPNGVRVANYASVGASPPGTDINSVEWNMILQRNTVTGEFELTEYDPNNMIGTVTVTVQEVDLNTIVYTFNIQFLTPASIGTVDGNATPPEDNMFIVTEIRDSNGGSARNIFNEGMFVNDIYAYPLVDGLYQLPVEVEPLCLNEDSTMRYTCAFDLVREWTIKQAEEKLQEMYNEKGNNMDSFDESERY